MSTVFFITCLLKLHTAWSMYKVYIWSYKVFANVNTLKIKLIKT